MKKRLNGLTVAAMLGLVALVGAPQAYATAELRLSDGVNSVDITDNAGPGTCVGIVAADCVDKNGGANVVTFIGTIGSWTVNVSTGASHGAVVGTDLDLNSVNSTTGASTLTITFSDTGFAVGNTGYGFHVGGTLQGPITVSYSEFAGATKFATTTQIGTTLTFSSSPFSGSTTGAGAGGALTERAILTATGAASTSFDAALTPVPEPTSIALFGGMLLFTVNAIRRRSRRA